MYVEKEDLLTSGESARGGGGSVFTRVLSDESSSDLSEDFILL